ncbi:hypothetical protein JG687_00000355 [Phytophthora cactorum]|uniref:Uncharacterized protein n=1 Tax=Phytophthora cactorum TaxID=29920 RepID=A0A8T1V099_9STRA|nr:hypothetical protein JG687_00000355 [Phytophthora cactorum]
MRDMKDLAEARLAGNVSAYCEQPRAEISHNYLYCWDNKYHHLPEAFEFPSTDPLTAWKLWWVGNTSLNYPPLQSISTIDLRRLSHFQSGRSS